MRLLLDTHAYFWWVRGQSELSPLAATLIAEHQNDVFISAVVCWELATKNRLGKWPSAHVALRDLDDAMAASGLKPLPITLAHARRAGSLVSPHKDPFDRVLAAQAALEELILVTIDPAFRTLACETLW